MVIYHEINSETIDSIFKNGLKRTSRGDKGSDGFIVKTDYFLDAHIPQRLRSAGISRDNNIYGYLGSDDSIIDIKDGSLTPVSKKKSDQTVIILKLDVDPARCWVSDLDLYDELKNLFKNNAPKEFLLTQAEKYWQRLVPLHQYTPESIRRPEIMITYDIEPLNIQRA